jgi:hypothetical protein
VLARYECGILSDGRVGFAHVRVVIALAGTERLFEERLTSG